MYRALPPMVAALLFHDPVDDDDDVWSTRWDSVSPVLLKDDILGLMGFCRSHLSYCDVYQEWSFFVDDNSVALWSLLRESLSLVSCIVVCQRSVPTVGRRPSRHTRTESLNDHRLAVHRFHGNRTMETSQHHALTSGRGPMSGQTRAMQR